jgi:hypothetical protein
MHYSTISSAAVLLALAPSAMAAGTAHVINNCGFPIYYASVGQSQHANMQELQGSYSESYSQPGVGVSIKLSPSMNGPVSQFEFTWADGKVYYDLSNIDGSPFADSGISIQPSMAGDSSNPTCQPVVCPAGQSPCAAAYNLPDDTRTTVCNENSDLTLTMCPGGYSSPSTSGSSPSSVADASTPTTPTPTPAATPSKTVRTLTSPTWIGHRFHPRHLPKA